MIGLQTQQPIFENLLINYVLIYLYYIPVTYLQQMQ